MRAERIAARVWPDRELEIEPLGGGITNHNFVVRVDGKVYVLQIAGADTELLGIDRAAEHEAARVAAGLEVRPEVVDFVEGSLITCFVEGGIVSVDEIRRPGACPRSQDCFGASTTARPSRQVRRLSGRRGLLRDRRGARRPHPDAVRGGEGPR